MHIKKTTLFLDIGGVILTNGWDHISREKAAHYFNYDFEDFEKRHREIYALYETGKVTLEEYLYHTLFWKKRSFNLNQFKEFMYSQSQPHPETLAFFLDLKRKYQLNIVFTSNEGRDLIDYRIKTFLLTEFSHIFFISCFIGYQKPDPKFYHTVLDVLQIPTEQILYIDDRKNLIEAAAKLGLQGIVHESLETTHQNLLGLL